MAHLLYVNTIGGMYLGIGLVRFVVNSVNNAGLEAKVFQREFGAFGGPERGGRDIDEARYKPSFRGGKVVWLADNENQRVFLAGDLAIHLVEWYIDYVREQTKQ